ncbi:MAG: peroxiredoxin [Pseudanabaena sp. ELA607]|jgi:peroxiredoxin Q/BCP
MSAKLVNLSFLSWGNWPIGNVSPDANTATSQGAWLLALGLALLLIIQSIFGFANNAWALGGKLPALNQPAPEFSLPANGVADKEVISLTDYRGQWVVLYFYPKDFTSGCTLEARRFQLDLPQYFSRNTQILGISADSVDTHSQFCDAEGLKFPLLADQGGSVSKAYGSWLQFISLRHTFIIDPQGILRASFVKVNPSNHSQEVLAKLEQLQSQG